MQASTVDNYLTEYARLNPAQKDAVDYIEGSLMIVAGAGTGKTQVIAMRIANILRQTQLNPQNILCLTFTEAGVTAMRERLLKIIGATAYGIRIYTFHAFCNEIISGHPEKFPELGRDAFALKDIDKLQLIYGIIDQFESSPLKPFGRPDVYLKEISSRISNLKNENISPVQFLEAITQNEKFYTELNPAFVKIFKLHWQKLTDADFEELKSALEKTYPDFAFSKFVNELITNTLGDGSKLTALRSRIKELYERYFTAENIAKNLDLQKIYENYQSEIRKRNQYDFEDMIMLVVEKLASDRELLSEYQEQYQYVLVDEYQDTNTSQNQTITLLGSFFDNPNIAVVGDDDQAIYRFQGASLENMLFFYQNYNQHVKLITLVDNYRSHQLILDAAKSLIENNQVRISSSLPEISKNLTAKSPNEPKPIGVHEFTSATEQYAFVAAEIKQKIDEGVSPKEIAVLFRENKEARDVGENLTKLGVAYVQEKGENVLRNEFITQFLWLLEYVIDSNQQYNLYKVLNLPFLKIPILDLVKANHYAYENRYTLLSVINDKNKLKAAQVENIEIFTETMTKLASWQQQAQTSNATVFYTQLVQESGFLGYLLEQPNKYGHLSALQRVYSELKELTLARRKYNFIDFVNDLNLYELYGIELIDKFNTVGENKVRLMTAHGAKGLEFDYVFVVNCLDKKWGNNPNKDKIKLPVGLLQNQILISDNDEERRLFYVALTRAKKHVYISYPKFTGEGRNLEPSVFINADIDKKYLSLTTHAKKPEALEEIWNGSTEVQDFTDRGKAYLKGHLHNLKLSVTHLNSYHKCPRCFYFRTVLRIPELKSNSLALGTAMHEVMNYWFRELKATGKDPTLEALIKRVESSLKNEILEDTESKTILAKATEILKDYYPEHTNKFDKQAETEVNFNKYNIHLDDKIPLTGKVDRIDIFADRSIRVIDYKTGNSDNKYKELNEKEVGDYVRQLVFYKIMVESVPSLNWKVKEGAIEFFEKSKRKKVYLDRTYEISDEQMEKVKQQIREVYAKIMDLDFEVIGKDCKNDELHSLPYLI